MFPDIMIKMYFFFTFRYVTINKTLQVRWVRVYHRSLLHHFLQHFKIVPIIFWKCPPQWEQHCLRYQSYQLSSIWPLQKLLVTRYLLHDCYCHLYKIVGNKDLIIKVNFLKAHDALLHVAFF